MKIQKQAPAQAHPDSIPDQTQHHMLAMIATPHLQYAPMTTQELPLVMKNSYILQLHTQRQMMTTEPQLSNRSKRKWLPTWLCSFHRLYLVHLMDRLNTHTAGKQHIGGRNLFGTMKSYVLTCSGHFLIQTVDLSLCK